MRHSSQRGGFTLLEIALSLIGAALILAAIYGIFSRAIHLRDSAIERTRLARLRARAASVIRNDLRGAFVSGGPLAASLTGSQESPTSSFPGYLKLTTTTGRDTSDTLDEVGGDVQEVEYFIVNDPEAATHKAGRLVRTVERNLLAPVREEPPQSPLLEGVSSMEVSFFDGQNWQSSWAVTDSDTTVPQAIRVTLRQAAPTGGDEPPPVEILVPWTIQAETDSGGGS